MEFSRGFENWKDHRFCWWAVVEDWNLLKKIKIR